MKRVSIFSVIVLSIFLLISCDKIIEELVVVKVPVETLTIHIKDIPVDSPAKGGSDDGLNPFNAIKTVGYSSIEGLTEKDQKYLSRITGIKSGSGSITITATDGHGNIVKNYTLKSDNVNPHFNISQCALGTAHTKDIAGYTDRLIMKILVDGDQDVLMSGKTDVPSGKCLNVKIILKDIVLSAKVIQ